MLKKNYLLGVSSLALLLTEGGHATQGSYFKSGAYVGANAGYSYMHSKGDESLELVGYAGRNTGNFKGNDSGLTYEAFAGYRHFFLNGFFIGAEGAISGDTNEIKKDNLNLGGGYLSQSKVKATYKLIPSIVFGKQVAERWLGFIKLGVPIARFKIQNTVSNGPSFPSSSAYKTKAGFSATAGGEYAVNENISALFSLSWEYYGNVEKTLTSSSALSTINNTIKHRPYYLTLKAGLAYRF